MVMSMFSSFDAVCAEISNFSMPKAYGISSDSVHKDRKENGDSHNTGKTSPPPPSAPPSKVATAQRKPQRTPRFAPEFDGVHCFETIVPY
ncbi:hypothetical protein L484_003255 [Morus notabilis]|uniref:Uncharacterized protein n=1 Tax=Morus notabilis TaxID=981085 RepID=W9R9W2_9ROSA|nr:uncharacterized protein LOC21386796 [Morus notabilis]EXB78393.1 hypothetical protein L484_003255 [Morus notabilis]